MLTPLLSANFQTILIFVLGSLSILYLKSILGQLKANTVEIRELREEFGKHKVVCDIRHRDVA